MERIEVYCPYDKNNETYLLPCGHSFCKNCTSRAEECYICGDRFLQTQVVKNYRACDFWADKNELTPQPKTDDVKDLE